MCLGESARAHNKAAQRNYNLKLAKRERDWMNTVGLTKFQHIQYEQGVTASNLGLAGVYGDIQEKYGDLIGKALQQGETDYQQYLQENKGGQLEAAGRTGRSIGRASTLDLAGYLRKGSRRAYQLTQAAEELSGKAGEAAGQARAQQLQMFAQVAFEKQPDFAPPPPVYKNVGMAMFQDALSIGSSIATMATGLPLDMFKSTPKVPGAEG